MVMGSNTEKAILASWPRKQFRGTWSRRRMRLSQSRGGRGKSAARRSAAVRLFCSEWCLIRSSWSLNFSLDYREMEIFHVDVSGGLS